MNTAIIYISRYGTTKKVAEKISEYLKNDKIKLIDIDLERSPDISQYDKIILGAGVYAGKISRKIYNFAEKNIEKIILKPLGLYICGMETDEQKLNDELEKAYPPELSKHAKTISCLGGEFRFDKMNFFEKAIIKKIAKTDKNISRIDENAISKFAEKMNQ
ncbi:MAG: flavodoxin domain-containing protein [Bacteroidales bacterium]|jgi:menaquinone-dependent protoporphyrinogen oxidase|nr:flavodoxin domain-containing protein [Bacteroidales bacterium]